MLARTPRLRPTQRTTLVIAGLACALGAPLSASAQVVNPDAPPGIELVTVDEHLMAQVPLDQTFRDHTGRLVQLADLVTGDKPVLLTLVYHSCPNFCSLVLDGVGATLRDQPWTVGEEFDVITLSIDPRDTPELASEVRERVLFRYGRPAAEEGWHFLVPAETLTDHELIGEFGRVAEVDAVADAIGFQYQWMPTQRQFAHPGVIMLLTPEGKVARYLYGIQYIPNDVRLGLIEAAEGRGISTVERVLIYCYAYDASEQGYVLMAWRIMRAGGALTAILLLAFLAFFWRRELRRRSASGPETPSGLPDEAPARS